MPVKVQSNVSPDRSIYKNVACVLIVGPPAKAYEIIVPTAIA